MTTEYKNEPSIVLRTNAYLESDLVVTLLTRTQGKLAALAKGARKSKKRFHGGIEIFDCASFDIKLPARTDRLPLLNNRSKYHPWPGLREQFSRFSLASLCLEAVDGFSVEGDPEGSNLFSPLFHSLEQLNKSDSRSKSSAITAYLMLTTLVLGGVSPLEDSLEIDPQTRNWLSQMATENTLILPHDSKQAELGLSLLTHCAEQTLARKFQTSPRLSSRSTR